MTGIIFPDELESDVQKRSAAEIRRKGPVTRFDGKDGALQRFDLALAASRFDPSAAQSAVQEIRKWLDLLVTGALARSRFQKQVQARTDRLPSDSTASEDWQTWHAQTQKTCDAAQVLLERVTRGWTRPDVEKTRRMLQELGRHTESVRDLNDVALEFNVVSWHTPDFNMKVHSKGNTDVVHVTSVRHFVSSVIATAAVYGRQSIERIRIYGHAIPGNQDVGGNGSDGEIAVNKAGEFVGLTDGKVDPKFDSRLTNLLSQLTPYFRRHAVVELHGCNVAHGPAGRALLKRLYEVWRVRVEGCESDQYPLIPGREGTIRSHGPNGPQ